MRKPCVRCGKCCERPGVCDIRGWVILPHDRANAHFGGECDQLQHNDDGTTTCLGIKAAFEKTLNWYEPTRKWLTEVFVGKGCEFVMGERRRFRDIPEEAS